MKTALVVALAATLPLVGCATATDGTVSMTPRGASIARIACTFDAMAPGGIATVGAIASIADPAFIPIAASANAADRLAHPLAVAACAAIPGQPAPLVVPAAGAEPPPPGTPIVLPRTS